MYSTDQNNLCHPDTKDWTNALYVFDNSSIFFVFCRELTLCRWTRLQRKALLPFVEQRGGTWRGKQKAKSLFFSIWVTPWTHPTPSDMKSFAVLVLVGPWIGDCPGLPGAVGSCNHMGALSCASMSQIQVKVWPGRAICCKTAAKSHVQIMGWYTVLTPDGSSKKGGKTLWD